MAQLWLITTTLSIHEIPVNSSGTIQFTIHNGTSSDTVRTISIQRPTEAITIGDVHTSWEAQSDGDQIILSGGEIPPGDSVTVDVDITTGSQTQSTQPWSIDVSSDASGNNMVGSSGDFSFTVTEAVTPTISPTATPGEATPTPTPVVLTTITTNTVILTPTPLPDRAAPIVIVHDVAQSVYKAIPPLKVSVKDESGIDSVWYTVNSAAFTRIVGISSSSNAPLDFSFTPKHATVSGLYKITVKAIDRAGNVSISTPITYSLDSLGPTILLASTFKPVMSKTPKLIGTILDTSGVASIDYSINDKKTWRALSGTVTDRGVEFSSDILESDQEGVYTLFIRATDGVGNTTTIGPYAYAIDRIAPRAGITIVKNGSAILLPDSSGTFHGVSSQKFTIYIPTIGGVSKGILLVGRLDGMDERISLRTSFQYGMWEASFTPSQAGEYKLSVELDDTIRPSVVIPLYTILITNPACILDAKTHSRISASVSIYSYDQMQQKFLPWKAEAFDQQNPIKGSCYVWNLPKGTYRLSVKSHGYKPVDTSSFTLSDSTIVSEQILMNPTRCFSILWFSPCLSWHDQVEIYPNKFLDIHRADEEKIFIQIPQHLSKLRDILLDTDMEVVMMNTWMPESIEFATRVEHLSQETNRPMVFLLPYEHDSFLQSWRRDAHIGLPLIADPDGDVAETIGRHTGPLFIRISKDGFIQSIQTHIETEVAKRVQ